MTAAVSNIDTVAFVPSASALEPADDSAQPSEQADGARPSEQADGARPSEQADGARPSEQADGSTQISTLNGVADNRLSAAARDTISRAVRDGCIRFIRHSPPWRATCATHARNDG